MPACSAFVGGTYQAISPVFAADTAVNVYLETRKVPDAAKTSMLVGTPGLRLEGTVATLAMRGAFVQDGRAFFVMGAVLYERLSAGVYLNRGNVGNDDTAVSMTSNGRGGDQLGIVSAGALYVLNLNSNVLTNPALPFTHPVMITFLDGYGLINEANSPIVWFSNLEDFTTWDALDFFARSSTSDNIVAITVSRDRVWCIGSQTTTLFYDSGDTDTPFVPYPGTAIQVGISSAQLLGVYADQLVWVADSARGGRRVVMATDAQPQQISTPPIEVFLSNCTTLSDAEMLVYEQEGHVFWCLTCPSSPDDIKTYCFDLTENMWHARAGWDAMLGVYTRWPARAVMAIGGEILVGDYFNGNLYQLDLNTYTNNGAILRRERTTPYLSDANQFIFVNQVQLGAQAGVGVTTGQGSDPQVSLEISRDGARTFTNAGSRGIGALGRYLNRCVWHRLGRVIANLLVLRVTQTDPVKTIWQTLFVDTENGTGQL